MRREHLRLARLAAGLTALELGERAGIREEKVFQVERGRYLPTHDEASRWATALRMTPAEAFPELFGRSERNGMGMFTRPNSNTQMSGSYVDCSQNKAQRAIRRYNKGKVR